VFFGPFVVPFAISVAHNVVQGNVQLSDNRSEVGGFNVFRNRIFENLQCVDNDPAPVGGENVVYGVAQEQCSSLAGGQLSNDVSKPAPSPAVEKNEAEAKKQKVKKSKKQKKAKAKKRR
jgi:hypothetical protein